MTQSHVIDYLLVHDTSEVLYFHNVLLFKDIMQSINKNVVTVFSESRELYSLYPKAKHIICYRTRSLPISIRGTHPHILLGYMIDDNIFYEGNDKLIDSGLRNITRNAIRTSDYCISFAENLSKELLKYNRNSHFIGTMPLWKERYDKFDIISPVYKVCVEDYISVGVIAGAFHFDSLKNQLSTIIQSAGQTHRKIKIIYFSNKDIIVPHPENIQLERQPYQLSNNFQDWYNALHQLELDFIYAEYSQFENHPILLGKSDVKFREAAYMKVAIVVVDPSRSIYTEIINGQNGWTVGTVNEAITIMQGIYESPQGIKEMGHQAYDTLLKRNPIDRANRINSLLNPLPA